MRLLTTKHLRAALCEAKEVLLYQIQAIDESEDLKIVSERAFLALGKCQTVVGAFITQEEAP